MFRICSDEMLVLVYGFGLAHTSRLTMFVIDPCNVQWVLYSNNHNLTIFLNTKHVYICRKKAGVI